MAELSDVTEYDSADAWHAAVTGDLRVREWTLSWSELVGVWVVVSADLLA